MWLGSGYKFRETRNACFALTSAMTNDISVDTVTHDSAELAHTPSSTTLSSQSDPPTDKTTDSILNHTNGNGSDHTGDVCNNQDHLTSATHNKEADEMCLTQAVRFNETPLEQKLEEHYYRMQMQMDCERFGQRIFFFFFCFFAAGLRRNKPIPYVY